MTLTKKHFIRAAEMVRYQVDNQNLHAHSVGYTFASLFSEFNPRFDTQRFLVACGLVDAPIKLSKRKAKV